MNPTRRGPRVTFQKRVPSDLAERFGTSPIRLPLPPCGAREAQRLAALLGGQLEVRFMEARLACMRHTLPAAAKAWIEDRGDRPLGAYER